MDNDCDPATDENVDGDGDGVSLCDGDCDDADATTYPGALELCDGLDNDCDPTTDEEADEDGDGYAVCEGDCDDTDPLVSPEDLDGDGYTGCDGDCDDADMDIHPGAVEDHDAVDNDCDGMVDEGLLPVGALIVTELMQNPEAVDDEFGEWFEVYNTTAQDVNLFGLLVYDLVGEAFTVDVDAWLAPGDHAVLARLDEFGSNGGVSPDAVYPDDFWLSNTTDALVLEHGGVELDAIEYTGSSPWPDPAGASTALAPTSYDHGLNDDGASWCETMPVAAFELDGGDHGTPGLANPDCCRDADGDGYWDEACGGDDCDDSDDATYPEAPELCDGLDNDCDADVDEDTGEDADGDGYNECQGDCDDAADAVYPGAEEVCDGLDSDCDGVLPDEEADEDADGYLVCDGDCDDTDASANPGAEEDCGDGVDNDCDGQTDWEDGEDCPDTGDDDDTVDDDDADDDADDDTEGGCECRAAQGRPAWPLVALGLAAGLYLRRRR